MRLRTVLAGACAVALAAVTPAAVAHDEFSDDGTKRDNRHALHDFSHESGTEGHIAANVNYGFTVLGSLAPAGVQDGRYTDVWADGTTAYVGTFQEPTCDRSGVYAIDIANPANPRLIAHIPSPPDTRVNDVKTVRIGDRTVLIHTLEQCGMTLPGAGDNPSTLGQGGISLWDVTDPSKPVTLMSRFLDFGVHNTFPWTDDTGKTWLILVDDEHLIDVHILDISKPQRPRLVSSTGLPNWPAAQDEQSAGMGAFGASFNHDVWVRKVGPNRFEALVSYWDAGWVRLDVSDPANPTFIDDSTYPDPDPITGISPPEGNAHAGVWDASGSRIYAGDEDFDPYRIVAEITSGPFAGEQFNATQGTDVPQIDEDTSLVGPTVFAGRACGSAPAPPGDGYIAVIERGDCAFTTKAQTVQSLGYVGGIVFNSETGSPPCEASVSMLVSADIPFVFVARSTGFHILGITGYDPANCPGGPNPPLPAPGTAGESVEISAIFDGWAYFHLLDASSLAETGYYAPGEVFDEDFASGFGDLSMHNVEGDPDKAEVAYVAWYSLGMRALEMKPGFDVAPPGGDWHAATPGVDDYYGHNVKEVGRFIAPEGSNFWGVHVHKLPDGQKVVLGSDRNTGLWLFAFDTGVQGKGGKGGK